jgi:hypothetical protein
MSVQPNFDLEIFNDKVALLSLGATVIPFEQTLREWEIICSMLDTFVSIYNLSSNQDWQSIAETVSTLRHNTNNNDFLTELKTCLRVLYIFIGKVTNIDRFE